MLAVAIQCDRPLLLLGVAAATIPWLLAFRAGRPGRRRPIVRPILRSMALLLVALTLSRPRLFMDGLGAGTLIPDRIAL